MIAVRMQRQQRALYEPGKRIHMIVLEAALRTRVCSPGALHGQLDRLLAIIGLPTLELGIIPFTAQVPVFPLSGFDMYDQDLVVVETVTGETQISDPQEVAEYERLFDLLREAAFYDDDAAGVIRQAIESRAREGSPQSPRRE